MQMIGSVRDAFPKVWSRLRRLKYLRLALSKPEEIFSDIYAKNEWNSLESRSGPGSTLDNTELLRSELPRIIQGLGVQSMLDAPCGDFHWMSKTPLPVTQYIGMDIVEDVIAENQRLYSAPGRTFQRANLIKDPLPSVDLIFCRDCLIHFSDKDARHALHNFQASGSRYLLTTTYPDEPESRNIVTGQWQALNLQADPFRLPPPIILIEEAQPGSAAAQVPDSLPVFRKCLGLWDLRSLSRGNGSLA